MSTLTSVDLPQSGKPSVRVRQPPGGGSSLNLFGGENPAPLKEAKVTQPVEPKVEKMMPKTETVRATAVTQEKENRPSGSTVHTSVKVKAPPGGKSSITFG